MHLHISRARRGEHTYAYGQIVESYRRADGMPTQRVIAKLGRLSDLEAENLRVTFKASRLGQQVVLKQHRLPTGAKLLRPTQSLRYLDLCVLLELWHQWKLDKILTAILPKTQEVAPSDVVAALTLQRCVDPGSKLYAERWFPRTALPELLDIAPGAFNNTRLHRVLEDLDTATPALMKELSRHCHREKGQFAALFLDVSDARFVGHGPPLAEKAKTKEGLVDRKIGIVLLCDERGFPLRWQVIGGRRAEPPAMHALLSDVRGLDWVRETPVVCDRAMGASAEIARLLRSNIRFVTALHVPEFGAYAPKTPHEFLADLEPPLVESSWVEKAARRAEQAGMRRVKPNLYVMDLGVVERDQPREQLRDSSDDSARAMRLVRQMSAMVDSGTADSLNSAARQLGVGIGAAKAYRQLLKLESGVQEEVLEGKAAELSLARLYALAALEKDVQRGAFDKQRAEAPIKLRRSSTSTERQESEDAKPFALRVRAVVAFNPELFVQQRCTAQKQHEAVLLYVRELNSTLSRPRSRRTARQIEADVEAMLRRRDLVQLYDIHVEKKSTADGSRLQVRLECDEDERKRRRRYHGFSIIVAHPDLPQSADQLCTLYRAKDAVEKDFQTIKSVVKLRPVWHRTDAKVRAHVTLCMLALLLERSLDERLAMPSSAALETLASCMLNRFEDGKHTSRYLLTELDPEQSDLLARLKLLELANDDQITEQIHPR